MENTKLKKLKSILKRLGKVIIAYSGGVDSTFLLKVAVDTLGKENVLAVTAVSPTYQKEEKIFSEKMAKKIGANHIFIKTDELKNKNFSSNPKNRCFYCKYELFKKLKEVGKKYKIENIIDGTNKDDEYDYRPGEKAKKIYNVISPLKKSGFKKKDIREFSKKLALPTWNKPALACLASRIPYNEEITSLRLEKIEKGEKALKKIGFNQVRLRDYGKIARIEVEKNLLNKIIKKREIVIAELKKLGYKYITVDLEGYRTGSMNEEII